MLNKIIISALLFVSVSVYSQILPLDISGEPKPSAEQFGSGINYNIELGKIVYDKDNLFELWLAGDKAYKENDFQLAKKYLVEFEAAEIIGENMEERFSNVSKFRYAKFHSSIILKEIFYKEKSFTTSLAYHNKMYKYRSGFWFNIDERYITYDNLYLYECYRNIGDVIKANQIILYKLFTAHNLDSLLIIQIVKDLKSKNDPQYLKNELENSIINLADEKYNLYYLNYKMYVYDLAFDKKSTKYNLIIVQNYIRNHLFYKLIMEN